uniref:Uncharacterized protein n=1 Tax=Ditylenchus dipsaci TaxID=166011 RepID=A0A915CKX6_9BILA
MHVLQADKVPSTGEIEDYKDPLISEIFSSINSSPTPPAAPSGLSGVAPPNQQRNRVPSNGAINNGQGQVPLTPPGQGPPYTSQGALPPPTSNFRPDSAGIPRQGVEQPTFSNGNTASSGTQQQSQLGELAVQGAQNFYTGFQQAGRLLGIDSGQYQQYEVPLVSSAASFFGRK